MSKSRIDRLGLRLREGAPTEADLRELSEYRETFAPAYRHVLATVRDRLGIEPTGRPAKSTGAIIDKLRRESIRLGQLQDIAGLRVVVPDIAAQDAAVAQIVPSFERAVVVDRRTRPSHGYRAVHVIVSVEGKPVEIQVRTALQHQWAELSEKLADRIDPRIKYGEGPAPIPHILTLVSVRLAAVEKVASELPGLNDRIERQGFTPDLQHDLDDYRRRFDAASADFEATLAFIMQAIERLTGET